MVATVITVSRTLGAGADAISRAVAAELGYRHLDREIIDQAAVHAGAEPGDVARVEERRSWIARVLDRLASIPDPAMGTPYLSTMSPEQMSRDYQQAIVAVIREVALQGNVVITAHGASIPLAGTPGLLRVFITAPFESRARRLSQEGGITLEAAGIVARDSDDARSDYFRRFYNLNREEAWHYDLAVNTEAVGDRHAAQAIVAMARAM